MINGELKCVFEKSVENKPLWYFNGGMGIKYKIESPSDWGVQCSESSKMKCDICNKIVSVYLSAYQTLDEGEKEKEKDIVFGCLECTRVLMFNAYWRHH